jgi:hypothetical protein
MHNKLILTDCDGVLLDWSFKFNQFMKNKGYTLTDDYPYKYGIENWFNEILDKKQSREIVVEFNDSAWIAHLPTFRDAVKYVKKLNEEHGYVFGVITSLTDNPYAIELRERNLYSIFGANVFDFIKCVAPGSGAWGTGTDKDVELFKFKDSECWWIEDSVLNAEVGLKYGLNPILMSHPHNQSYSKTAEFGNSNMRIAGNWKEIYNIITGEI